MLVFINYRNWRFPSWIILLRFENNRGCFENEIESGHFELAYKQCSQSGKKTGRRPTLVRRISFTKKLEVLHAAWNLAETKIKPEKGYSAKVREIHRRLIPYLRDARQQGNTAYFRKDKLVMNRIIRAYMIWNIYKKITRYRTAIKH